MELSLDKKNLYSYHKNLVYASTQSDYQILMRWWLILEEFGPIINHIYGVDNILADILSRFPYTTVNQYENRTTRYLSQPNKLLTTRVEQTVDDGYSLDLELV